MSARHAKVQAEYERLKRERKQASQRGEEATTPKERAGTPKRSAKTTKPPDPVEDGANRASSTVGGGGSTGGDSITNSSVAAAAAKISSGRVPVAGAVKTDSGASDAATRKVKAVEAEKQRIREQRRAAKQGAARPQTPPREKTKGEPGDASAGAARSALEEKARARAASEAKKRGEPRENSDAEARDVGDASDAREGGKADQTADASSDTSPQDRPGSVAAPKKMESAASISGSISSSRSEARMGSKQALAERKREIKNRLSKAKAKQATPVVAAATAAAVANRDGLQVTDGELPSAGANDGGRPQPPTPEARVAGQNPTTPRKVDDTNRGSQRPVNRNELARRLHSAVGAEKLDIVELQAAIKGAADAQLDLDIPGPDGSSTALYSAADMGHAKAVELLRRNGADIMRTGPMDVTPIFIACYKGHHDVVSIIVNWLPKDERWRATRDYKEGNQIKVRRGEIFHPHDFGKADRKGMVEGFIQGSESNWPRAEHREVKAPLQLFEKTTERDIQLEKLVDNSTPFFIACQEGHTDIVRTLFEAGVNIETPDVHGATPFYSACQHGHTAIVRYLFGKTNPRTGETLDPEKGVHSGEKPLDAAKLFMNLDVLAFLSEPYNESSGGVERAAPEVIPLFDTELHELESDTDDEKDLLRQPPRVLDASGAGGDGQQVPGESAPGAPSQGLYDKLQPSADSKKIRRGKTKTLDLAMRRRGSVYSAGFLVEEEESEEFEADGEEEDETRLRLTQVCPLYSHLVRASRALTRFCS